MKRLALVALTCMAVAVSSYAQGTVNFNTRVVGDVDAKVFDIDGTTPLAGTDYYAQLWGGPAGSDEGSLVALMPYTTFRTGAGAGYVTAAGEVVVTGVAGGNTATLQLRVWANNGGALTSFADAETAGVAVGKSALFEVAGLGNPAANPPTTPPNLVGLQSFSLVPEPTTYALLAIGLAALAFRRRK